MTKKNILDALNGNNYAELLSIYNKYKIKKDFDIFFEQNKNADKNSIHFKILHSKVKDILRKLEQSNSFEIDNEKNIPEISVNKISFKKTIERPIIDSNPHVNRAELPENMQALYDENGRMNNEMKSMHAAMKVEPDIEKRKVYVTELCTLEEKINKNWEVIDKWYQDFKSGIKVTEKKLDPLETNKKIEAAEKYMDRNFNSTKPKSIAKFNEYKNFLNEIGINYIPRPLRENKRQKKK